MHIYIYTHTIHIYVHVYVYVCVTIYIYIYTHVYLSISLSLSLYIYIYIHTQLRTLGCTRSCARRSACCPCATSSAAESSSCTGASFPRSRKHELANQLHSHMYIYICIYIYIYIALTAGRPLFWRAARLRQQWFTPLPACLAPTLVYLAFVNSKSHFPH